MTSAWCRERGGADEGEVLVVGHRPADATIFIVRGRPRARLANPGCPSCVLPGNVQKVTLKPKALSYAPEAPALWPY